MGSSTVDIISVVSELNEFLSDKGIDGAPFTCSTDGYTQIISYGEVRLWCSEDDNRRFIEETNEYEDIKHLLIRELLKVKDELKKSTKILKMMPKYDTKYLEVGNDVELCADFLHNHRNPMTLVSFSGDGKALCEWTSDTGHHKVEYETKYLRLI